MRIDLLKFCLHCCSFFSDFCGFKLYEARDITGECLVQFRTNVWLSSKFSILIPDMKNFYENNFECRWVPSVTLSWQTNNWLHTELCRTQQLALVLVVDQWNELLVACICFKIVITFLTCWSIKGKLCFMVDFILLLSVSSIYFELSISKLYSIGLVYV